MAVTETNTPLSLNSPLSLPSTIDNSFSLDNFSLMPTTLGGFNSILPELTTIPFSDDLFSGDDIFSNQEGLSDPLALDFVSESSPLLGSISDTVDVADTAGNNWEGSPLLISGEETAANGLSEAPTLWILDPVIPEIKHPSILGLGSVLGTTNTAALSGATSVVGLARFAGPIGIAIAVSHTLLQDVSLNTGPNTFSELTPEQRELARLPGFTFPLDGQIDSSVFYPAHEPDDANAYEGGDLSKLPDFVSSPFIPPDPGLVRSTANVDPVDVTLNASPMMSARVDNENNSPDDFVKLTQEHNPGGNIDPFSANPDDWLRLPANSLQRSSHQRLVDARFNTDGLLMGLIHCSRSTKSELYTSKLSKSTG